MHEKTTDNKWLFSKWDFIVESNTFKLHIFLVKYSKIKFFRLSQSRLWRVKQKNLPSPLKLNKSVDSKWFRLVIRL